MIRILIVDDSPSIALLLRTLFDAQPDMEVVGHAANGREAIRLCETLRPSVITMDIRMPELDGIEATRQIMQQTPTPIVVVSAVVEDPLNSAFGRVSGLGDDRAQVGFRALEVGALAVLQKPPGPANPKFRAVVRDLIDTVRAMAAIKVFKRRILTNKDREMLADAGQGVAAHAGTLVDGSAAGGGFGALGPPLVAPAPVRHPEAPGTGSSRRDFSDTLPVPGFMEPGKPDFADTDFATALPMMGFAPIPHHLDLVAIAASTGGPQALAEVLSGLPVDFPVTIVVVQHIAEGFIGGLAEWLGSKLKLACSVASDGEALLPGRVYLAPDGHHLLVSRAGTSLRAHLFFGAPVSRHLPSATPFFQSIARSCGQHALGLVMTGMGTDGAEGLLALRRAGGVTLAQSPATCVAPSMPQMAIELGAVDEVVPLNRVALRLKAMARYPRPSAAPR